MSYVTDGIAPPMETGEFATEAREFSIVKAIQASSSGNWSQAGRERECHEELVHRHGQRSAQGILIPNQSWQKRTYVAGTDSAGGNLIATDVLADQFVDALRPNSVIMSAGATTIPGLVGDVSIPKRTGSSTAAWFGADDSDALSESTGTFGTVTLSPKTVGSYSKFSRLMKLQSLPHIEDLIRQDMLEKIGTQIDIGAISGTGSSSQPTGILSASGTTVTALATNGAAASIDNLITLKKSVSAANADDSSCCYLINSKVESALSQLKDSNGQYHLNPFGGELGAARFAGRRMLVSNNVPSNLSKGSGSNLSAILYGRFSDVLIGQWSGVEIEIDPFTDFAKGTIGIRALATIDVGVRHGESFGLIKDAIAA
jgi:HK97 family phage major capsid protein